jgi:(p)ppGpp synthase/HD superfamily hydrolase
MDTDLEIPIAQHKLLEHQLLRSLEAYSGALDSVSKLLAALRFIENIIRRPEFLNRLRMADILAAANILVSMSIDIDTIIAGLFYKLTPHIQPMFADIARHFGEEVVDLIYKLNKLQNVNCKISTSIDRAAFKKLISVVSGDTRIFILMLADRLYAMRTISSVEHRLQKKIALETMRAHVPIADRIGMQIVKNELQELSFSTLHPQIKRSILIRLNVFRSDCVQLVPQVIDSLKSVMEKNQIACRVFGREKTPYSILDKMKRKSVSFRQISDIMAFRILVDDVQACYLALGALHTQYQSIPGHFKDFISAPKENNYRSLHTVLVGPEQKIIEVQIRTYEMQSFAEYGLAAHQYYKQCYDTRKRDWHRSVQNSFEAYENIDQAPLFLENGHTVTVTPDGWHSDEGPIDSGVKIPYGILSKASGLRTLQHRSLLNSAEDIRVIQSSTIYLTLKNTPGALASVATELAKHNVSIDNIKTIKRIAKSSEVRLDLTLKGMTQLAEVIHALKSKKCVNYVNSLSN